MSHRDPFEGLESINPVPPSGERPDSRSDPAAQALLARIQESHREGAPSRHRRRVRHFLIPVVGVAAATTTAAAAWVIVRAADDPTQVACYRAVDLDSDIVGLASESDPIAQCRRVWETGGFGDSRPPELHACVLRSGIVGVFPADDGDPCARLGLEPADLTGEAPAIVAVQGRLAERFIAECVPLEAAATIVATELRDAGLDDWTVTGPGTAPPDRPCGSIAVDVPTRTITVVAVPTPPSG